mmetsp:Transcript_25175/g.58615  ORF Transcript_25175/g.58615 Transcript_25175/m.58615 type:complete len:184 (-) Transcript_25175:101-652(-)
MMITMGNAVGTWVSMLPLRLCTGASTSEISGSCSALPGTVDTALAKMRGLQGGKWEPCGVCRGQERLGWTDVIRMHGFVIVKLHNKEARTLIKYLRMDWGHDGFAMQTAATDDSFHSYSGFEEKCSLYLLACKEYRQVAKNTSMKTLIDAIDAKKHIAYDLASWNCNHFANSIVEVLTGDIIM